MLFLALSTVLAILLGWLYYKVHQRNQYWAKRGVPHAPPHFLLGNLSFVFKQNVGVWMRDLQKRYPVPYFGIWVFWKPVLVVSDPQVAKRVLVQDSDLFRNRYLSSGSSDPIGSLNLFTVNDPTWTNVRRRLTYIFTAAKLKALQGFTREKARAVVERIKRETQEKKFIELRNLMADFTTDIIGTFAFGIENNAVTTGDSPIRAVTREFMKFNVFRGLSWYCIFFWPKLVNLFRFSLFPKKTTDFFVRTVKTIIQQRMESNIQKNDLLDALIKMKQESLDEGQEISDDLLAAQACIMLQGGFDTTAGAMTFALTELAHNPEIQERVYQELVEAKDRKGGADLDFNDLEKLTYLNCIIKETTRKYPPMGWLDRIAATDYKIDDKLTIDRGTPIYINAIGMHFDPKYFPDPEKFDPDRFLPENESAIVPYSYLPFGDGPRICIGMRFAQMTMRTNLSEIILNLEMKPLPDIPRPQDMVYETKGMFLFPGAPMSVKFIPRD